MSKVSIGHFYTVNLGRRIRLPPLERDQHFQENMLSSFKISIAVYHNIRSSANHLSDIFPTPGFLPIKTSQAMKLISCTYMASLKIGFERGSNGRYRLEELEIC